MKWIKYYCIVMTSTITGKTVVNFFGKSYAVAGNTVRLLGGKS